MVGAPSAGLGVTKGRVYIYESSKHGWRQTHKLAPQDISIYNRAGNGFGTAVAFDGNRLAIGAIWDDDVAELSGALYLYNRLKIFEPNPEDIIVK